MTENKRFELIDDYIISYDGDYFDLHKLSDIRSFVTVVGYVIDENEQLKQSIKEVLELLEEEVDLFSDNATEHDINAYSELRKFDNKDAYYMAISTKKAIKILKEGNVND